MVHHLLRSGFGIVTGCATGADAAIIRAAIAHGAGNRLSVFAAHGPIMSFQGGRTHYAGGCWTWSALAPLVDAINDGARVKWWSGGGPEVPITSRLARRSLAAIKATAQGGPGSLLIGFPGRLISPNWRGSGIWYSCGSGSWSSIAAANALSLPVVVFPMSTQEDLPALPSEPGQWVPAINGWGRLGGKFWRSDVLALL